MFIIHRYGLKIWLTEFAKCCTRDEAEVLNFVKVTSKQIINSSLSNSNTRKSFQGWNKQILCTNILGSSPDLTRNMDMMKMIGILTLSIVCLVMEDLVPPCLPLENYMMHCSLFVYFNNIHLNHNILICMFVSWIV